MLKDIYYIVMERILNWRRRDGEIEFLIKWQGYANKHNTWELLENLNAEARELAMQVVDRCEGRL